MLKKLYQVTLQRLVALTRATPANYIISFRPSCTTLRQKCLLVGRLLALCAFLIFSPPGFPQDSTQCIEAASLWLPTDNSRIKVVSKWSKDLRYGILSGDPDSAIVQSIETELKFVSQQTGLSLIKVDQFSKDSLPDLVIVIHPDLESGAERLRETALKFFQVRNTHRGYTTIDAAGWAASLKNISPKCGEIDSEINGDKDSSFAMVQEDASMACIRVGLAESFGLVGARDYYNANGQTLPNAIIGVGLRSLYSDKIRSGMSRTEVSKILEEACK